MLKQWANCKAYVEREARLCRTCKAIIWLIGIVAGVSASIAAIAWLSISGWPPCR